MRVGFWAWGKWVLWLLVLVTLGVLTWAVILLPPKLSPYLQSRFLESCQNCELRWESLRVRPTGVQLRGLHFRSNSTRDTVITADVDVLHLVPTWAALRRGEVDLRSVTAWGAKVEVAEGVRVDPPSPGGEARFAVRATELHNAHFRYQMRKANKVGAIEIDGIEAKIGAWGTLPDLRDRETSAEVKARLEESGKIDLAIQAFVNAPDPQVKVQLALSGFPLARVNGFFDPIEGVRLSGKLARAESQVVVEGKRLRASADLTYEGFDLKFLNNEKRSGLTAFFSNILADIKLAETQKTRKRRAIVAERQARESLVSFILRGMKEASLAVAEIK